MHSLAENFSVCSSCRHLAANMQPCWPLILQRHKAVFIFQKSIRIASILIPRFSICIASILIPRYSIHATKRTFFSSEAAWRNGRILLLSSSNQGQTARQHVISASDFEIETIRKDESSASDMKIEKIYAGTCKNSDEFKVIIGGTQKGRRKAMLTMHEAEFKAASANSFAVVKENDNLQRNIRHTVWHKGR